MREKPLFDNSKFCTRCKRIMSLHYAEDMCPACINQALFEKVRDYVWGNEVTEHQLAEKFNIPLSTIHEWIKDGRLEYKDGKKKQFTGLFCQKCGASITFGTICTECKRSMNISGTYTGDAGDHRSGKMRFN